MNSRFLGYGQQLMIDAYDADVNILNNISQLYNFLDLVPDFIGMHKIGFPHLIKIEDEVIGGISGFVFIMESHISIHTYAHKNFMTLDVYSCKEFDQQRIIKFAKDFFKFSEFDERLIFRAPKYK